MSKASKYKAAIAANKPGILKLDFGGHLGPHWLSVGDDGDLEITSGGIRNATISWLNASEALLLRDWLTDVFDEDQA